MIPSTKLLTKPSINAVINAVINQRSTKPSTQPPTCPSICPSNCPSNCPSTCPSACPSINPSIYPPINPISHPSIHHRTSRTSNFSRSSRAVSSFLSAWPRCPWPCPASHLPLSTTVRRMRLPRETHRVSRYLIRNIFDTIIVIELYQPSRTTRIIIASSISSRHADSG